MILCAIVLLCAIANYGQTQTQAQDWTGPSGDQWKVYAFSNNTHIAARAYVDNTMGKYYGVLIWIRNNSGDVIQFDPSNISAYMEKKGKVKDMKMYDFDSYISALKAKQTAATFGNALLTGEVINQPEIPVQKIKEIYVVKKDIQSGEEDYMRTVMVEYKGCDKFMVKFNINGVEYVFEWNKDEVKQSNQTK